MTVEKLAWFKERAETYKLFYEKCQSEEDYADTAVYFMDLVDSMLWELEGCLE